MAANLGQVIRDARTQKGLSQDDLADKIGVSQQSIAKWEGGTSRPRGKNLNALKAALGIVGAIHGGGGAEFDQKIHWSRTFSVRRARLRSLIDSQCAGNVTAFAEKYGYSRAQIYQFLSETYNEGRSIGEMAARNLEAQVGLQAGFLDQPSDDNDEELGEHETVTPSGCQPPDLMDGHGRITDFRQAIRGARNRKGLSQAELADQIGVSQAAIGQWERGEFTPRGKNLKNLREVLGIDADDQGDVGQGSDQFALRLPDGIREAVKEMAEQSRRTMNAEFVFLIEQGISLSRSATNQQVASGEPESSAQLLRRIANTMRDLTTEVEIAARIANAT